jgi:hypothetical protein
VGTRKIVRRVGVPPIKKLVLSIKSEDDEIGRRGVEEIGSPLGKALILIEGISYFQISVYW